MFKSVDVISLRNTPSTRDLQLDSDGIAWLYDSEVKFAQVKGFVQQVVHNLSQSCSEVLGAGHSDCRRFVDPQLTTHYYWYPDDEAVQYLHETFPDTISPLEGVTSEHFINWMRTAGLPSFRKLYGKIDGDFRAGDQITFDLTLNYEVLSFGGTKSLVITNLGVTGTKSTALSGLFVVMGSVSLTIGVLFALKRLVKPRPLGDIRELSWNSY